MKKLFSLLITFMLCLSLCACGQSEEAKIAQEAIAQIGEVTYSSGDVISEAEELFNKLTEEEQKSVKNADVLNAARETYNAMVSEPLNRILNNANNLTAELTEHDYVGLQQLIDAIRSEMNAMEPALLEIVVAGTTAEDGTELLSFLDDLEVFIEESSINDTYLAQPGLVITLESNGFWLVNDHGNFAAYNWWGKSLDDAKEAYTQYKEYVEKFVVVQDSGSSFTFQDNSGDLVTVLINSTSKEHFIQVRVPRF